MTQANADRNLLFGVVALQMDFISRDALVGAMNAWVLAKEKPLGRILVERGDLGEDEYTLLEALVQKHLARHSNDAARSLAACAPRSGTVPELARLADVDVQASLARIPDTLAPAEAAAGTSSQADDPNATRASTVSLPESAVLRFRILRPHARGGLGEVFVAHDSELNREVALKEIQLRHANNMTSRSRFQYEAEVTGRLEHPSIVPVYGMGSYPDGRPFYAMRFIRGESLMEAIERLHGADGPKDAAERGIQTRQLLGRFVDVCNAVAYAHDKQIIHRDLKPQNVMLGPYGETLVVDWGLAKPVVGGTAESGGAAASGSGSAGGTQAGQAVGTPQYMSPEQAEGRLAEIGPASDVYSLGATLYCVLTGQAPFLPSDVGTMLRQVSRGEFLAPRRVSVQVPPALDAICLKAMALKPGDRYPSARALADDVERWLADEPVAVYREPWTARLSRWGRRHRTLVVGAAALLVTAVIALTVSTVLIAREEARTAEQRSRAEANFQTALRTVDDLLTEVAEQQLATEPRMEKKRQTLLAKARDYYRQFLEQRGTDSGLRKEAALAAKRLADIDRLLQQYEPARNEYDQAVEELERLTAEHPDQLDSRAALGESYCSLGEVYRLTSRLEQAAGAYEQALKVELPLTKEAPDRPAYRKELARTYYNQGILFKDTRRPGEAETALRQAITVLAGLVAEHPESAENRRHLARGYLNLGPVLRATDRPLLALEAYQKAVDLQSALAAEDPQTPDYRYEWAVTLNNLGFLLQSMKRLDESREAYRKGLELLERLALDYPSVPVYRKELANISNNNAIVRARAGDWSGAESAWESALSRFEKLATEHPDVPDYAGNRGMAVGNLGWLRLQTARDAGLGAAAGSVGGAAARLAELDDATQRLQAARSLVRTALKANQENPTYLSILCDQTQYLAEARAEAGDNVEAARLAEELPTLYPGRAQDYAAGAGVLALCSSRRRADAGAADDYGRRAVRLLEGAFEHGWRDVSRLEQAPLNALAERDDFRKMREKWTAAGR